MSSSVHQRVLALLRAHGRNTCSFQALESGLDYWFDEDDACVAYADTGSAWIAAGEPIAAPDRLPEVARRFGDAARAAGRRPRFFGLEHPELVGDAWSAMPIGTQPIWDPEKWAETLTGKKSLREQLRRARAKGVAIREIRPEELEQGHVMRRRIDELIGRWLGSRALAPMSFLVTIDVYHAPEERRFLVAERGDDLVGILVAVPVYAKDGWFFEDVLRDPSAPNGTIELLFDHAMRLCREAGSRRVTFGLAPLADVPSRPLVLIRDHSRRFYDFDGLRRFKAKLEPCDWEPVFLGFPARERGASAIVDSLRAFAGKSFRGFLWQSMKHRAHDVVLLLTLLLIPWTALLAQLPERFFPSSSVQLAWVAFDLVLLGGLLALLSRWRRGLATLLSVLAGIDAVVGSIQFFAFNFEHTGSVLELIGSVASLLAPTFASLFLWKTRGRYDSSE